MTQIAITVPNDIRAYLELRAERHGLSLEMLLRQAVELYIRSADAYAIRKALN
jgi:plasmid stability protein